MHDDVNPYETPFADSRPNSEVATHDVYARVGHVAVNWEKLRLVYNAVLAVVSAFAVLIGPGFGSLNEEFGSDVLLGVVVSNALYCMGPLIDGYLTWFGLRSNVVTLILFAVGTAIASLLALVSIVTWGMPWK